MNQPDPKQPVSLEDLLHLKRAERPPEGFWLQFESELRAKQLAAIVDRSPWWNSWRGVSHLLARQALPIGATAALALGLLSFHEYRSHSAASVMLVPVAPVAPSVSPSPRQTEADASASVAMDSAAGMPADTVAEESSSDTAAVASATPTAPASSEVSSAPATVSPAAIAGTVDPFSALVSGSSNRLAVTAEPQNDTWTHFGDKQLASNTLVSTVGFTPHAFAAPVSEPLAQMDNPLDERRAMLLSGSLPHSDNAGDDSSTLNSDDHSASHLSDDRLYESVSRLSAGGNRLSIRF